jgi:hypothetical protein
MNDGANLADRIRDKIAANLLPHEHPEKTGTGHGAGDPCAGCEEPIKAAQVEYRIGEDTNITHRPRAQHALGHILGDQRGDQDRRE